VRQQEAICTGVAERRISTTLSILSPPHRERTARSPYADRMELEFSGEVWFWRGPAPWHFVTVPDEECAAIEATSPSVSYGWGMIPVAAQIGSTRWKTSLWPKDERYIVPLKTSVRTAESIALGDVVTVRLAVDV
jgi:hypothetical protein